MTSWIKHIGIKYYWFRSKIKSDETEVVRVSRDEQQADLFTKGLTKFPFEQKMKLVMEW